MRELGYYRLPAGGPPSGIWPSGADRSRTSTGISRIMEFVHAFQILNSHSRFSLDALVTRRAIEELQLAPGMPITAAIKATSVQVVRAIRDASKLFATRRISRR
jgi:TOBE domain